MFRSASVLRLLGEVRNQLGLQLTQEDPCQILQPGDAQTVSRVVELRGLGLGFRV